MGATPGRPFDPRVYRDPRPFPALIHALGPLNRHVVLPHVLRLRRLDLPAADLMRLRAAVHPGAAAFIGPNHPEFMTDWMLDKEISRRVSPLMAHWASYEIVNVSPAGQWFWLSNNLIANAPGGGGTEYSVRWSLKGHGVLLHPEGTATWHGDHVAQLVPGIVDMAWEACRAAADAGTPLPVHLVPVVWKLHFEGDVGRGLDREMALIEKALELPAGAGLGLEARFAQLQAAILGRSAARHEVRLEPGGPETFFTRQRQLADQLTARLTERYGDFEGPVWHRLFAMRRAVRQRADQDPDGARRDRRVVHEIERLHRFVPDLYDHPTLTQEQIAETLQQIRSSLVTRGWRNALHNMIPVAVAPRIARIRVPEPIAVHHRYVPGDAETVKAELLDEHRRRLQNTLDAVNAEIAPLIDRWRRPNPMWTGSAAGPREPHSAAAGPRSTPALGAPRRSS